EAVGDGAPLTCGTADGGNGQPVPTHHQIVREGTVVHGHGAAFVEDGATTGDLSRCPEGLVVGEVDMRQAQAAAGIVDAPTPGFCPGNTEGLVLGHYDMGQAQVAAGVPNAATPVGPPVGDRQAVDGHGHGTVDSEDAAAVVAADGQPAGARAVDDQVVRDAQLAAGQHDGAVAGRRGEVDHVGAGLGVGVKDCLPQRTGSAVGEIPDRQGARHGPVLQGFQPGYEALALVPFWAAPSLALGTWGGRFQASEQRGWPHGSTLHFNSGLPYNG